MTKGEAHELAKSLAAERGGAWVVWRRNLAPKIKWKGHINYDFTVDPQGVTPTIPNVEAVATYGEYNQGGLDL